MRSISIAFFFVILLAVAWAVHTPLSAGWNVRLFSQNRGDLLDAEESLIRLGPGALPALRGGLADKNASARFHCAKVLLVLGENEGETFLLEQLRAHPAPEDGAGREAEGFLLSAWDRRDGPSEMYWKKLHAVENVTGHAPEALLALNECLVRFPRWADGYARRARLYQQAGEVFEAKRDAIYALTLAPNHFEALATLGRIQLAVEAPTHAYKCFERAVLVNPRMKETLKDELRDALKAIEIEKEKHREDKRKNTPLV